MLGKNVVASDRLTLITQSGNLGDAVYILEKIRSAIAAVRYLNIQTTPNVNSHLTSIVNNVGAQWRHSQQVYNMNHPDDPTSIGDFWTEWVKDFYDVFVVRDALKFCRTAIDALRRF